MTETATYRPAKLEPVTSPTELRERTVRDYRETARRAGLDLSATAVERQAVADLQMVDAFNRGIDRSPRLHKRKPQRRYRERPVDLPYKDAPAQRDPEFGGDLSGFSVRWPFAMGRMKRILEGARPHIDPMQVALSCAVPELALAALRLHRDWLMRGRESKHNPFRGLDDYDARRKLVRMVEDLCDRSTGKLGPWWVK